MHLSLFRFQFCDPLYSIWQKSFDIINIISNILCFTSGNFVGIVQLQNSSVLRRLTLSSKQTSQISTDSSKIEYPSSSYSDPSRMFNDTQDLLYFKCGKYLAVSIVSKRPCLLKIHPVKQLPMKCYDVVDFLQNHPKFRWESGQRYR